MNDDQVSEAIKSEKIEEFPVIQEQCPYCGSEDRVIKEIVGTLERLGKIKKGLFPDGVTSVYPLMDPTTPPTLLSSIGTIKIPLIRMYPEQCGKCKKPYYHKIDMILQEMIVPVQQIKR